MAEFKQGNLLIEAEKSVIWSPGQSITGQADGTLLFSATTISGIELMEVHGNEWHSEMYATVSGLTIVSGSLQNQINNFSGMESHGNEFHTSTFITSDALSGLALSNHNHTSLVGDNSSDDLQVRKHDDPTKFISLYYNGIYFSNFNDGEIAGLQRLYFGIPYSNSLDIYKDNTTLKITAAGGLTVNGTSVSLDGHTHDYAASNHDHDGTYQQVGDYATDEQLNTISGALHTEITELFIPTDFYSTSEVDTISGSIVAQIPSQITDYITDAEMTTISGDITAQIPTDYATVSELTSVSGALQAEIDVITSSPEGVENITNNSDTVSVVFSEEQDNNTYSINASIENTIDSPSSQYTFTITSKSTTGFTATLSSPVDSGNYKLNWKIGNISVNEYSSMDYDYVDTVSGSIVAQIPTDYISDSEMTTISGNIVSQITSLATLNPSLSTDHAYSSTAVATGTAGEALTFGQVCYFKNDGKYWKSCATASGSGMPVRAIALESINADASGNFLVGQGYVRDDSWTWTTAGDIYASTTSGTMTQTVPATAGNVVQLVGYATASGTIFFNPDTTYIVRA